MIQLSQGKVALVDDDDYDAVSRYRWHPYRAGDKRSRTFYAKREFRADGRRVRVLMHQFLTGLRGIDHADGNGLNNQRSNLRIASNSQQTANQAKYDGAWTSQYKGVWWAKDKKRWRARIMREGKHRHIGYFRNEVDAAKAYDVVAAELFGEFARLNFP